jgi:hypothetical protein
MNKIRKIPPVCLLIAFAELLIGRLRLSKEYVGATVRNKEGQAFKVFRNIKIDKNIQSFGSCVFVVNFKFARLSHRANKVASIIPMLLIAGLPGFVQKLYAVNKENGYWQGMYEWRSVNYLEAYQHSFVYRMMNKRARKGTVQSHMISNCHLSDLIEPDKSTKGYTP